MWTILGNFEGKDQILVIKLKIRINNEYELL